MGFRGENNPQYGKPNLSLGRYKGLPGMENPNWRGGRTLHGEGYICLHRPEHPHSHHNGYVFEHRLVMEEAIGRYLEPEEIVHHVNGDVADNRLENLMLFKNVGEHTKYHNILKNGGKNIREVVLVT
jgi:hypothetical protein